MAPSQTWMPWQGEGAAAEGTVGPQSPAEAERPLPECLERAQAAQHRTTSAPLSSRRRYLVQEANVALVPGDAFGAPGCIRISYAASLETLGEALDRMAAALKPDRFTGRS